MSDLREQLQSLVGSAYTLEQELAGGGMSRVFTATEPHLGRRVVIKVLPPELAAGVKVERFKREVKFLARLQHAHIVPLLAAGGSKTISYYVMPFLEGESLRSLIAERQLRIPEIVRILREVASALSFAHGRGIVHRDIKPDNVLICGGAAMVSDFGVAKALAISTAETEAASLTSLGMALGTPAYIAPEQATADPASDHRADIYSFGATAYEMLAGRPPFAARSQQAMLAAHVTETPRRVSELRPDTPQLLDSLVMMCLEKEAADRPQTADRLIAMLDAASPGAEAISDSAKAPPAAAGIRELSGAGEALSGTPAQDAGRGEASNAFPLWARYAAVILLFVAVGGVIALMRPRVAPGGDTAPILRPIPSVERPDTKSIAVLPLVNVSGDARNEYFSDGMTDELANALGRVAGLRVASRTSAFAFKGVKGDAREIGRKLNVGALLEGTVRREGDRLRVQVQLTNVADGLSLWGESYERRMKDVFSVQDSIAYAIVAALQLKLTGSEQARLTQRGTTEVEALDLYHRGHFLVGRNTEPDIRRGLDFYQQALTRDPSYARAWAGVAYAWIALADDFVAPADAYPTAKLAAAKAISLDPRLAEARAALGAVYLWFDWNFRAAEKELTEAIRLEPNGVYAYRYYGNLLKATGRFDSALVVIRKAQQLEPLSAGRTVSVALMYTTLRQFDAAIREAQLALELDSAYADAFLSIGSSLLAQGKPADAIAAFRHAPQMGNRMMSAIASAEAARGNREAALKILRALETESRQRYIGPEAIAAVYFSLGDHDAGFTWLERAYQARSAYVVLLRSDRRWDAVRSDPRFRSLVRKVGV